VTRSVRVSEAAADVPAYDNNARIYLRRSKKDQLLARYVRVRTCMRVCVCVCVCVGILVYTYTCVCVCKYERIYYSYLTRGNNFLRARLVRIMMRGRGRPELTIQSWPGASLYYRRRCQPSRRLPLSTSATVGSYFSETGRPKYYARSAPILESSGTTNGRSSTVRRG